MMFSRHLSRGEGRPGGADGSASSRRRRPACRRCSPSATRKGGNRKLWVERFKQLGPIARDHGVLLVVKQHGGETGTGERVRRDHPRGQRPGRQGQLRRRQRDGLPRQVDPIPDIQACAGEVRSFCIKDHRNFRRRTRTAAPASARSTTTSCCTRSRSPGLTMPLCCENIFAPLLPRPDEPEGVDALARRAREFLEVVTQGVQRQAGRP